MNIIKYWKDGKCERIKVSQPSYARLTLTRANKLGFETAVPLRHPTVAQADRAMLAKGFTRKP